MTQGLSLDPGLVRNNGISGLTGPGVFGPERRDPGWSAIESHNARYRRAISVRGHFPTEQAALKCLYLEI